MTFCNKYEQIVRCRISGFMLGALVTICLLLSSCEYEWETNESVLIPVGDSDLYWYTRTRSAMQQQVMLRNHGVGFSYDATNGSKCDVSSVRCQIVDLKVLEEQNAYRVDVTGETVSTSECSRGFTDYCHNMNVTANVSGDVLIYKEDYRKVASLFEHALDTMVCFTSIRSEIDRQKYIDMDLLPMILKENPEKCLSVNFLYAIDKIKASDEMNVAVIDSFINIFGTHVIVDVMVGGKIKLDVITERKAVKTYIDEKMITEQSLNVFFKKYESSLTETEQKYVSQLLENAQLHFSVLGGDLSKLNTLVANPSPGNAMASSKILTEWQNSIQFDEDNQWNGNCEMIDMEVVPIWDFILDKKLAARVKSRVIATASTMQDLYGNRNFLSVSFSSHPTSVTATLGGRSLTFNDPWVVDVIAANRRVATICKEWVPEIDLFNSVQVVYPIYENRMQIDAGLCIRENVAYQVKWLYDRFEVKKLDTKSDGDMVYLNFGYLDCQQQKGITYQDGKNTIGYEWPGSILINGSLSKDKPYYETRKFLGHFYLNTGDQFTDLPNWLYVNMSLWNRYYETYFKEFLSDKQDLPFELSGIKLDRRSGEENLKNRMVRNTNYVYYINPTELGL